MNNPNQRQRLLIITVAVLAGVWLGDQPADAALKKAMLGG